MARRKKIEEKNYNELIQASEERIAALSTELKEEKASLKQLKKDKIAYDKMMEDQKKENEIKEITAMIVESGKSVDEIKYILLK